MEDDVARKIEEYLELPIKSISASNVNIGKDIVKIKNNRPNLLKRLFLNRGFGLILGFSNEFIAYTMNSLNKSGFIWCFS